MRTIADNYVSIRIKADDSAKPELDDLKAKLDELGRKVATARAEVDGKKADAVLAGLDARLEAIGKKVARPKIDMTGAKRALADMLAVDLAMDRLKEKADAEAVKGGLLSRMLGGIGGGLTGAGGGLPGVGGAAGSNPYAAGGIFAGLIASAPFVGQLLASGIVGGLGAGLAGMGIAGAFGMGKAPSALQLTAAQDRLTAAQQKLAALQGAGKTAQLPGAEAAVASAQDTLNKLQNQAVDPAQEKMRQSFSNLTNDVQSSLSEIGKSFRPMLNDVFRTADGVLQDLTPVFAAAEKMISGPLGQFADTFLKAFDQPAVKTSILAIGNAFSALVAAVTPQLPNDFRMIANAITAIANNVAANPQAFSGFINFLVKVVVYALNVINALTAAANFIERDFVPGLLIAAKAVLTFGQEITNGMHAIADTVLSAFGMILHGAATAFGWVPGVGGKLRDASKAFDDFKAAVDANFTAANGQVDGWKRALSTMQTKITLKGDITDLQNKLLTAKNMLDDPNLTKARRTSIQGNIADLQAKIAYANSLLDFLNGKTVTTYVATKYYSYGTTGYKAQAHGGVVGAASGGVRSSLTLVGEHGPELVSLPAGSTVHSNPDTQRMLGGAGGGRHLIIELRADDSRILSGMQAVVRESGGDPQMFIRKVAFR